MPNILASSSYLIIQSSGAGRPELSPILQLRKFNQQRDTKRGSKIPEKENLSRACPWLDWEAKRQLNMNYNENIVPFSNGELYMAHLRWWLSWHVCHLYSNNAG